MYPKKDPEYFRFPVPCLDLCQGVMLLVSSEASFRTCGTFPAELAPQYPPQLLILCRTPCQRRR